MDLILLKDWNGLRCGFRMASVPSGQAELLVSRGIAKLFEEHKQEQKKERVKPDSNRRNRTNI